MAPTRPREVKFSEVRGCHWCRGNPLGGVKFTQVTVANRARTRACAIRSVRAGDRAARAHRPAALRQRISLLELDNDKEPVPALEGPGHKNGHGGLGRTCDIVGADFRMPARRCGLEVGKARRLRRYRPREPCNDQVNRAPHRFSHVRGHGDLIILFRFAAGLVAQNGNKVKQNLSWRYDADGGIHA